jgi:hypothetical protein
MRERYDWSDTLEHGNREPHRLGHDGKTLVPGSQRSDVKGADARAIARYVRERYGYSRSSISRAYHSLISKDLLDEHWFTGARIMYRTLDAFKPWRPHLTLVMLTPVSANNALLPLTDKEIIPSPRLVDLSAPPKIIDPNPRILANPARASA